MDLPSSTHYINGRFRFFSQTTEARNAQIYADIFPEGLCIMTGNDVTSYFRSAANRVHATAAVVDFTVTKQSFWKISETARASSFNIYNNVPLNSLYISTRNDVIIYFQSAASRKNVFILGHVWVAISR